MHTVVSVKNPIGSAIMPSPFERGLRPRNPALGESSEERASGARRASGGGQSPFRVQSHRLAHELFSTLQTKAFPSWIETLGSATRAVSSLAASPVISP